MDALLAQLADFASAFTQEHRLFQLRFSQPDLDLELLPHAFDGEEQISAPYQFHVECVAADAHIELKRLLALGVDIAIQLGDGGERVLSGIVSSAQQLGSDGGFARYRLTVEPALATLKLRRNSRVFQDKSVIEIVSLILDEHIAANSVFAQYFRRREALTLDYPTRSFCQQYRESDFDFIERLLREEGISYTFEFNNENDTIGLHTFVLFDSGTTLPAALHSDIRFHRADATEDDDTITDWHAHRQIGSGAVALTSFDYKGVYTQNGADSSTVDRDDADMSLTASLEDYDPQTLTLDYNNSGGGSDDSDVARYAKLRQQAHDLATQCFSGSGVVRGLGAGQTFRLHDHPLHTDDANEFVVLKQRVQARNNLFGNDTENAEAGIHNTFTAMPVTLPLVPAYAHSEHAKPTALGIQTATVVGPADEEIFTDELGRVKIQYHWARPQDHNTGAHGASADKNDFSSCWVRVGYPSAGANWGHQFIPRIGQEVVVSFLENDIDRPVVTGVIHNGQQNPPTFQNAGSLPANKTLSGIKTKEYKSSGYNELLFDDSTGEIRTKLSSEHGKTQLNQGFLIHPRTEGNGEARGEGFELRTDNAGAVRAAQGLLISTEPQPNANGGQLDREQIKIQLQAAQQLTTQLGNAAQQHNAAKPEPDTALDTDHLNDKHPHLYLHGTVGLSFTTPQSIASAAGKDIHQIAQGDTHQTTGRRWIANAVESISLFVAGKTQAAIKLFAAKGNIQMQAQSADIEIDGDQSLTITACKDTITASAQKEIILFCGGAQIKLSGGNIEVSAPGNISLKGAKQLATGPTSMHSATPVMPNINFALPPEKSAYSTALTFSEPSDAWQPMPLGQVNIARADTQPLALLSRPHGSIHASGYYTGEAIEIAHWLAGSGSWQKVIETQQPSQEGISEQDAEDE